METNIVFDDISKFYGEVLGVNRVNLSIPPGITSLVGPNGSGKTTMMNLMTGLLQPSQGQIRVLGTSPMEPDLLFRKVGYCTQYDSFPKGLTGRQLLQSLMRLHGFGPRDSVARAERALEKVGLLDALERMGCQCAVNGNRRIKMILPQQVEVRDLYSLAAERGIQIRRLHYKRDSLEDIFLKAMEENHGRL